MDDSPERTVTLKRFIAQDRTARKVKARSAALQ